MDAWVLLALSLFLLTLEFFLPGGILAVFASIVYIIAFVSAFNQLSGASLATYSFLAITLPVVVVYLTLYRMRKSAQSNTFFLAQNQEGYQGAQFDSSLIGKIGIAATDLGPSGFAVIEGKRVQVISQSSYIEKGKRIAVMNGRGAYLIVQEVTE